MSPHEPTDQVSRLSDHQATAIRVQLKRIRQSDEFRVPERCRRLLAYVVTETLAGHGAHLKGYTIAVEVLERDQGFDPDRDPIVRIEVAKLRRALERYYLTAGSHDPVRIDIPKGGCVPTFDFSPGQASAEPTPDGLSTGRRHTDHGFGGSHRPVIAVLPFAAIGPTTGQDYFADGLTEEIMDALGHFSNVGVCSGLSTHRHQGQPADVRAIGRNLGVRFVLQGSVRRSGNRVRLTTRLYDSASGTQLWSSTFERRISQQSLFAVQNDIARNVAAVVADRYAGVAPRALMAEAKNGTKNQTAYNAVLRYHRHNLGSTTEPYAEVRRALEQAVKLDPEYATGWATLAEAYVDGYTMGWTDESREAALAAARQYARKALHLDRHCEQVYWTLGYAALIERDWPAVLDNAQRLISLDPPPSSLAFAAWLMALAGQWEQGLGMLHEQMAVLPTYPGWLHHADFLNYYRQGKYEEALQEALSFNTPNLIWDPLDRAAALGQLGRAGEARAALDEVQAKQPDFADHPRRYLECFVPSGSMVDHILVGLKRAGLQPATEP